MINIHDHLSMVSRRNSTSADAHLIFYNNYFYNKNYNILKMCIEAKP